jgi:hypothetical protein
MGKNYQRYATKQAQIFEQRKSEKAAEEMIMTVGLGLAPVKAEGAQIFLDNMNDGYTVRAEHSTVALGFAITAEAIEDNLYESKAELMGQALSRSLAETKELRGASIFNLAFDSGTPIGDGVSLCNASHPLNNGGTVSNTVSADLSETAIKNAITKIRTDFVDDRGLKVKILPRKLIVHPNDAFTAYEILKSDLSTSIATVNAAGSDVATSSVLAASNRNNVNSLRAGGLFPEGHMVYDYLTDTDAWFILTDVDMGLVSWQRRPMEVKMDYTDPFTGNIITTASERYAFMVGNWRKVYGSAGA